MVQITLGIKRQIVNGLGNKSSQIPLSVGDKNGYSRVNGIISPSSNGKPIEQNSPMGQYYPTNLRKSHYLEKK
jgi:hypothetical protein